MSNALHITDFSSQSKDPIDFEGMQIDNMPTHEHTQAEVCNDEETTGLNRMRNAPSSVFFAGCSWGCAFFIGVYKGLVERWGIDHVRSMKFGGNSSGAMIAFASALGVQTSQMEKLYTGLASKAVDHGVFGKMSGYHSEAIADLMPNGDEYLRLNGRLFLGVTMWFKEHAVVSHWNSNQELVDTLHASFHVPFYCTHTTPLSSGIGIDGMIAKSFYRIDSNTLIVDARSQDGDIVCSPSLTFKECVYPLLNTKYIQVRDKGARAIFSWNGEYNQSIEPCSCGSTITLLLWALRYMEDLKDNITGLFSWKTLRKLAAMFALYIVFRKLVK